ncbi:unnamed protein product, partial [Haemonchus placei]|uniref:MYND-type domain-containing protein n=1 Tax=Haemonchus placei TaxID=6290 RepID=A0A0N4X427_HAEPC
HTLYSLSRWKIIIRIAAAKIISENNKKEEKHRLITKLIACKMCGSLREYCNLYCLDTRLTHHQSRGGMLNTWNIKATMVSKYNEYMDLYLSSQLCLFTDIYSEYQLNNGWNKMSKSSCQQTFFLGNDVPPSNISRSNRA